MMFNGLLTFGESDSSDFTKESLSASSVACSGRSGESEATARAHYYHNKLLATMQILQNKEETVRVQGESLAVAESRIAALTARVARLRRDLDEKALELHTLRQSANCCDVEKIDVAIDAHTQVEEQKNMVKTLQNNLSIIEELYRECFYETAKQEELMETLRDSYIDVRLMDKEKSVQIDRLQNVINTQKWSLDRCQDIALEVNNLKLEIMNFLNNSNNDSGVWERSECSLATEITDDLHDIVDQLVQLRDLLAGDCTCGLKEENMQLREKNQNMEIQIGELRQKIIDLETVEMENEAMERECKLQINSKDEELHRIRQQLASLEKEMTCRDSLKLQLQQAQVLLNDKSAELVEVRQQCQTQETTILNLKEELDKANEVVKQKLASVENTRQQLAGSEHRISVVERELRRVRDEQKHTDDCYKEKAARAVALQAQLVEARARGAALCAESRRALTALRCWAERARALHREQQDKIKDQETLIQSLRQELHSEKTSSNSYASCECIRKIEARIEARRSACDCTASASGRAPSYPRCIMKRVGSRSKCRSCVEERRIDSERWSESEVGNSTSPPVPPRRLSRMKLPPCGDRRCKFGASARDASAQRPERCDAAVGPPPPAHRCGPPGPPPPPPPPAPSVLTCTVHHDYELQRELSPDLELMERVERLHEALEAGQRRWSRSRLDRHDS